MNFKKISWNDSKLLLLLLLAAVTTAITGFITALSAVSIAKSYAYINNAFLPNGSFNYNGTVDINGLLIFAAVPLVGFMLGSFAINFLNKYQNSKRLLVIAAIGLIIGTLITALNGEVLANQKSASDRHAGIGLFIAFDGLSAFFMAWIMAIAIGATHHAFSSNRPTLQHRFLSLSQSLWALCVAAVAFITSANSAMNSSKDWFVIYYIAFGLAIAILILTAFTNNEFLHEKEVLFKKDVSLKTKKQTSTISKPDIIDFEEQLSKNKNILNTQEINLNEIKDKKTVAETASETKGSETEQSASQANNDQINDKFIGASESNTAPIVQANTIDEGLVKKVKTNNALLGWKYFFLILLVFSVACVQITVSLWWAPLLQNSSTLVNIVIGHSYYPTAAFFIAAGFMSLVYSFFPKTFLKINLKFVLLVFLIGVSVFIGIFTFTVGNVNVNNVTFLIIMGLVAGIFYSFTQGKIIALVLANTNAKFINRVGLINGVAAIGFNIILLVIFLTTNNDPGSIVTDYVSFGLSIAALGCLLILLVFDAFDVVKKYRGTRKKEELNELITF